MPTGQDTRGRREDDPGLARQGPSDTRCAAFPHGALQTSDGRPSRRHSAAYWCTPPTSVLSALHVSVGQSSVVLVNFKCHAGVYTMAQLVAVDLCARACINMHVCAIHRCQRGRWEHSCFDGRRARASWAVRACPTPLHTTFQCIHLRSDWLSCAHTETIKHIRWHSILTVSLTHCTLKHIPC